MTVTPNKVDQAFVLYQQTNNPELLAEVFDGTVVALQRLSHHLTPDFNVADDLLQATFLTAIECRQDYKAEARVLSWLFGIMVNHARVLRRSSGRILASGPSLEDVDSLLQSKQTSPQENLERKELSEAVEEAIGKMSELYHPVLNLHLRYGLSASEIGVNLRRTPVTVRKQLERGLDLLRKALPSSLIAGTVVLTTKVNGVAAMREVVLGKATTVAAEAASASSVLGLGKFGLWIAAGTLTAAALALTLYAPDKGQVTFDELPPKAVTHVVAPKGSVDSPATASAALQADPFSPSTRVLMAISNPVSPAPGGANNMNANKTPPSSISHNLGVPALLLGAMTLLPAVGQGQSVVYYHNGETASDLQGSVVSDAGDVNLDGTPDFVTGAYGYDVDPLGPDGTDGMIDPDGTPWTGDEYTDDLDDNGRVYVVSGKDGTTLYTFDGEAAGNSLGASVSGAGDVNFDGFPDIVAGGTGYDVDPDGTPGSGDELSFAGRVYVFSGKDGTTLLTVDGEAAGDAMGGSVSDAGDVNLDNYPDIVAGTRWHSPDPDGTPGSGDEIPNSGRVYVYSGLAGTTLWTMEGEQAFTLFRPSNGRNYSKGEGLGSSLSGAGDVNLDGTPDIVAGARSWDDLSDPGVAGADGTAGTYDDLQSHGRAYLISGASLSLTADKHLLSLSVANSQTMTIDAGVANAGKNYWLFTGFAASGDTPGVTMAPGVVIPLNQPDPLTSFVIGLTQLGGGAPTFAGWKSTLDGAGMASPSLNTFGPTPAPLGVTLHHAALVYTADGCGVGCDTFQLGTNWVPMTTTP